MSGICGVWRGENAAGTEQTLKAIAGGLAQRPAEQVQHRLGTGGGVALAARFETQQMHVAPQTLLACDADLYNEKELRQLAGGESAAGGNGTAALLAALYRKLGPRFVEKLRGAFSIVIWDDRERRLVAAIDRFGMRRLVFYRGKGLFAAASRIDALMRCDAVSNEINPRAVMNVLNYSASLAPETIFRHVERLQPGHLLVASGGETRIEKYWDMRYGVGSDSSVTRLGRQLENVVEESVTAHLKQDSLAETGAFLSGGTDSSTVTGMMSRAGRGQARTFSIGFQEQPFNELEYAEIAARRFQTDHHTYLVGPDDCFQALPDMIRSFDEPFGNSSAIPTYFCARLAAQNGVKVLLAGDGGDELFGGNSWYATDRIFQLYQEVPAVFRKGLIEPMLRVLPGQNGLLGRARSYVRRSSLPPLERILSYHFVCAHTPAEIFEADFLGSVADYSVLEAPSRYYREAPARDHLDRVLYLDVKTIIGDSDLPKVTCMSELAGIRPRFPFLDPLVAEFSGRIPARLKIKGFEKRYLFKRAFAKLLPVEIIKKKKHGFGIPVAEWLKSDPRFRELSRDTLLSTRAFQRGYFRKAFIEELFRKHDADDSSYYGDSLWTFLALELWHRQAVDEAARMAV